MIETKDANDILDLAHWLAGTPDGFRAQVTDDQALDTFRRLVTTAAEDLNQTNPADHAAALVEHLRARRTGDAAAQALCRAADDGHQASDNTDELFRIWKEATSGT
jgi:hypothetical protein